MIRIDDVKRVSGGGTAKLIPPPKTIASGKSDFSDTSSVAVLLATLLADAAKAEASAVHIEPHGKEVLVRYRIDGLLREGKRVPRASLALLTARIKSLANLDTKEVRVPQDGRFETTLGDGRYVVRAALLPVADGEKIVLHIVDQSGTPHELEQLGYWGHSLQALRGTIDQTHGLVVVSGPTGSGKTSTLYGLLHLAADPALNIVTVEDTIEHRLPGINQTPVNTKAGMTFAGTLRAVIHQDPNVLMISELREPEATGIALQAALAGRLVLAGMVSRDVAATLSHIVAMNIEPYLLASATRAVANQRLVRRLCMDCRESYKPGADEIASACTACGLHPQGVVPRLAEYEKNAAQELSVSAKNSGITGGKVTRLWRAKAGGCAACGQTGYKGRMAIAEVLTISPAVQKLVFASASGMAIYDQAIIEGMVPLPLDGLVKALLGLTSVEEVLRVVTQ